MGSIKRSTRYTPRIYVMIFSQLEFFTHRLRVLPACQVDVEAKVDKLFHELWNHLVEGRCHSVFLRESRFLLSKLDLHLLVFMNLVVTFAA
jgi:hypothetical protein